MKKDFLTLLDRSREELKDIINRAIRLKDERNRDIANKYLAGKSLAMIFEKSSTRTRISFEVGMYELGGHPLFLSSNDIQLGRGESIKDTARVLSRYVHCIMIRTFEHERVVELARYADIPVINGLTNSYHPCQVMADIMTIYEKLGKYQGVKVAYVGDGNNMAHSWMNGCALFGMNLAIGSPIGYEVDKYIHNKALEVAKKTGAKIELYNNIKEAVKDADIVYTDVWTSMGQESESKKRLENFKTYEVNSEIMNLASKDALFMHCLPAHLGEEVSEEVFESKASVVFDEAENRLHVQKAIILDCMNK